MKRILLFLVVVCACLMPYNDSFADPVRSTEGQMDSSNVLQENVIPRRSKVYNFKIVDAGGNPVIGAFITVDGTGAGTSTDIEGNARLVAYEGARVTITFVGFIPITITLGKGTKYKLILSENPQ